MAELPERQSDSRNSMLQSKRRSVQNRVDTNPIESGTVFVQPKRKTSLAHYGPPQPAVSPQLQLKVDYFDEPSDMSTLIRQYQLRKLNEKLVS